jgi:gamma-glutamyltranspeptidase
MIPVAVVNAIVHFVDGGLPFPEAVTAPRIAPAGEGFSMETHDGAGWSRAVVESVRSLGMAVTEVPREAAFGRIHGIRYHAETGRWEGVADPDWEGTALGARKARVGGGEGKD